MALQGCTYPHKGRKNVGENSLPTVEDYRTEFGFTRFATLSNLIIKSNCIKPSSTKTHKTFTMIQIVHPDESVSQVETTPQKASKKKQSRRSKKSKRSSKRRQQRQVSFSNYCDILEIPTLDEYSDEEVSAVWFTEDEQNQIFLSVDKTLQRMNKNKALKADKYCSRGLECFTTEGEKTKMQRRNLSRQAVLQKQFLQKEDYGSNDPETIARVYAKKSFDSLIEARLAAIEDETQAKE